MTAFKIPIRQRSRRECCSNARADADSVQIVAGTSEADVDFRRWNVLALPISHGHAGLAVALGSLTGFNRLTRCSMVQAETPGGREEAMRWLCPTTRWPIPTRRFSSGRAKRRPG